MVGFCWEVLGGVLGGPGAPDPNPIRDGRPNTGTLRKLMRSGVHRLDKRERAPREKESQASSEGGPHRSFQTLERRVRGQGAYVAKIVNGYLRVGGFQGSSMGTLGWTDFQGSSRGSGVKGVRGRGIPRIVNGYMRVGGFQGSAYVRTYLVDVLYIRTYVRT